MSRRGAKRSAGPCRRTHDSWQASSRSGPCWPGRRFGPHSGPCSPGHQCWPRHWFPQPGTPGTARRQRRIPESVPGGLPSPRRPRRGGEEGEGEEEGGETAWVVSIHGEHLPGKWIRTAPTGDRGPFHRLSVRGKPLSALGADPHSPTIGGFRNARNPARTAAPAPRAARAVVRGRMAARV